jgi:hemerythrin superfamily protein
MYNTITEAIRNDHRELEEIANDIFNTSDVDDLKRYQNQFTWGLTRHLIGEELVVYPVLEHNMGGFGEQIANEDRREHQNVSIEIQIKKWLLTTLTTLFVLPCMHRLKST